MNVFACCYDYNVPLSIASVIFMAWPLTLVDTVTVIDAKLFLSSDV